MEEKETVTYLNSHFTPIVKGLKVLGKEISQEERVEKILRSMTKNLEARVFVITKAKDLTTLPYEEPIRILLTHENMITKTKGT